MIPLVAACALFAGLAVGLAAPVDGARTALAAGARGLAGDRVARSGTGTRRCSSRRSWDVPASLNRRAVTECLAREYRGEKILASMGSLAHYMQELSHAGFDIADFIHEGNGVIWNLALETGPAPHAGWMLVEEEAEGGDVLAASASAAIPISHEACPGVRRRRGGALQAVYGLQSPIYGHGGGGSRS